MSEEPQSMKRASDPIHDAAALYASASRALDDANAAHSALLSKLDEAKALNPAAVYCDVVGQRIALRSHKAIDRLFRRAREGQNPAPALAAAEIALKEELDRERARVATVKASFDLAGVETTRAAAMREAEVAYLAAVRTVPSTLAGLRVLAELIGRPPANDWNLIEPARRSLVRASSALLPEQSQ